LSRAPAQCFALLLLFASALLLTGCRQRPGTRGGGGDRDDDDDGLSFLWLGAAPVALAALSSGFTAALTQKVLKGVGARNSSLFSIEVFPPPRPATSKRATRRYETAAGADCATARAARSIRIEAQR